MSSTKSFFLNVLLLTSIWIGVYCIGRTSKAMAQADSLASMQWWQMKVKEQSELSQNHIYKGCLFGDSISSGLDSSLGEETYNFALPGLSSVSLVEQLKQLKASNFQCQQAIIAIGTNDALYGTSDQAFIENVKAAMTLVQSMGQPQIVMIAAFYSTQETSYDPSRAGTNERIQEINGLIKGVASERQLFYVQSELEPLFKGNALREDLTYDGVHLNNEGRQIYKQVVMEILNPSAAPPDDSITPSVISIERNP